MAAAKEEEAKRLLEEAERKIRGARTFLGGLFGGSSRLEEATECLSRAGNMFKMGKNWSEAGNAFSRAAELHLQLQSKPDAASAFVDSATAFRKCDPQESIQCLLRAIDIYTDMAVAHYEQAADYYKGEESTSSANKCLLKVASIAAQLEQFPKAIGIYEQVGSMAMDSPLLKYGAKDHFFRAALCHFCVDALNAKLAVQKYEEMFPAFSDCRECRLLKKLLEAHEEQNVDAFTDAVREFDSISRLDQWQTTMLLRVKRSIPGEEEQDLR